MSIESPTTWTPARGPRDSLLVGEDARRGSEAMTHLTLDLRRPGLNRDERGDVTGQAELVELVREDWANSPTLHALSEAMERAAAAREELARLEREKSRRLLDLDELLEAKPSPGQAARIAALQEEVNALRGQIQASERGLQLLDTRVEQVRQRAQAELAIVAGKASVRIREQALERLGIAWTKLVEVAGPILEELLRGAQLWNYGLLTSTIHVAAVSHLLTVPPQAVEEPAAAHVEESVEAPVEESARRKVRR